MAVSLSNPSAHDDLAQKILHLPKSKGRAVRLTAKLFGHSCFFFKNMDSSVAFLGHWDEKTANENALHKV